MAGYRLQRLTVRFGLQVAIAPMILLSACGSDVDPSPSAPAEQVTAGGEIDIGLAEARVSAGESSFLVTGGTEGGESAAKVVKVEVEKLKVSKAVLLGAWAPDLQIDATELADGSWLVALDSCSEPVEDLNECTDDHETVAVSRISGDGTVEQLGQFRELRRNGREISGYTDQHVVFSIPETDLGMRRFLRLDLATGRLDPIDLPEDSRAIRRMGCVSNERLAILSIYGSGESTAAVADVGIGGASLGGTVEVPLPEKEQPYALVCAPEGQVTVMSTDATRLRMTAHVLSAGRVDRTDPLELPSPYQHVQADSRSFALVTGEFVREGEGPPIDAVIPSGGALFLYTSSGWEVDATSVSANERVFVTGDQRSLLLRTGASSTVRGVSR